MICEIAKKNNKMGIPTTQEFWNSCTLRHSLYVPLRISNDIKFH